MLFQLILADIRERTRRYSFLITLGFVLFFGYLVISGKYVINLGECRGYYNSAWVGGLMATGTSIMLFLLGFYLVKNTIQRDRSTGVGEILATTPISKLYYLFAKFLSNVMVLSLMVLILVGAAVVMQLLVGVTDAFNLWALAAPFLFITFPVIILVSAAAVLFESIRLLRGTFGNILYFFAAEGLLITGIFVKLPLLDFSGMNLMIPHMQAAARAAYPTAEIGMELVFAGLMEEITTPTLFFRWQGIDWSLAILGSKLVWIAVSLLLLVLAAFFFNRFDPSREKRKARPKPETTKPMELAQEAVRDRAREKGNIRVKDLAAATRGFRFIGLAAAELRLLMKGHHWAWYLTALAFIVLELTLPIPSGVAYVLPWAWIWPIAVWSSLGTREKRFNTGELLFSSPYPLMLQLPAAWTAGAAVTFIFASGLIVRSLLAGESQQLLALLAAVVFIPTLAMTLGIVSSSNKPFEVVYTLAWYLGPINHITVLNFMGTTPDTLNAGISRLYFFLTAILLPVIFLARKTQIHK